MSDLILHGCPNNVESSDTDNKTLLQNLRRRAMDYLARREHTGFELRNKLTDKFPDADSTLIDLVLDKLVAERLLSDERFAESYVRSRVNRGYGPVYIKHQLRIRKVDPLLIDKMLDCDESVWVDRLEEVVRRKSGAKSLPLRGSRAWQKLQRFVLSRGFTTQLFMQLS